MKQRKQAGLAPGSLIFTGRRKVENPNVTVYYYNSQSLQVAEGLPERDEVDKNSVLWIDVRGLHEIELVRQIGAQYNLHPLAMEDILDIRQRPKFEEYDDGLFFVLRSFAYHNAQREITPEQISVYSGPGFVLSFQEDNTDVFAGVRRRLDQGLGQIRTRRADYLAYALADNLVDTYFHVLDTMIEDIATLEDQIMDDPTPEIKRVLHRLKQCTLVLRRGISPEREAINAFARSDSQLIDDRTKLYVRDVHDHILRAIEINDTARESLTSLQDLYLSEISFRMNKVMQTLTIVATIFIPLTFLAGIYGMNFEHMPELHYRNSYFILLAVMLVTAICLLIFFRRKHWF